jgi:hypothetical protein
MDTYFVLAADSHIRRPRTLDLAIQREQLLILDTSLVYFFLTFMV